MLKFNEGEWWKIAGRGNVFATKMPEFHPVSMLNTEVLIQGETYTVIGVEMTRQNDSSLFKGRSVGLLVRGPVKHVEADYDHGQGD